MVGVSVAPKHYIKWATENSTTMQPENKQEPIDQQDWTPRRGADAPDTLLV